MLPGWVVAVTEPRAEARAVASVKKLGYQVFYPKVIRRQRLHGKRSWIILPLFPRYFFTWVETQWSNLLSAQGIVGLLMQGENLATIRAAAMKELQERCDERGVYLTPSKSQLQRGQKVKVLSGTFADRVGVFDGMSGQYETALFNLLGAETRVLFKEGMLIAI